LPKGDPRKVKLARLLRQQTTVTLQWIADRLKMGTASYLFHLLAIANKKGRSTIGKN